MIPRSLRLAATFSLLAALAQAQGDYYVNGLTGTDSPSYGSSAATPWKTIGYAMANVPPQSLTTSAVIHLAGSQVYSPATNGESFPITPVYNVALEAMASGSSAMPVIDIPAGQTGFLFPPSVDFNRNQVTFDHLAVRGGDYGLYMGSTTGVRHRPRVQFCRFEGQSVAAVSISPTSTGADDPRFFQNTFRAVPVAIEARAALTSTHVAPDIDECRFLNCGIGLTIASTPPASGSSIATALVRSCNFERCSRGISITSSESSSSHTDVTVHHCRLARCGVGIAGVQQYAQSLGHCDDSLAVEQTVFVACTKGIALLADDPFATGTTGSHDLTVTDSTFSYCDDGIDSVSHGNFATTRQLDSLFIVDCGRGVHVLETGQQATTDLEVAATRIRRCPVGIAASIPTADSVCSITNCSIAQCWSAGVFYDGISNPVSSNPTLLAIGHSTIADCGVGVEWSSLNGPGQATIEASLFAYNVQTFAGVGIGNTTVNRSCFDNYNWTGAGSGNLANTNPQLDRGHYKLSPGSPCIDAAGSGPGPATDYEGDPRPSPGSSGGPLLVDIGADEYVYAGSARAYGNGGFGDFNVFPTISAASPNAPLGSPIDVQLTGAIMPYYQVPANFALLTIGWHDDSQFLPFDLGIFGLPGRYLLNDYAAAFPIQTVSASGTASFSHVIPNNSVLVGVTFAHQWFVFMPAPNGVISSDGLRVTLGQ